ncbi:MAG: DoxX family protein [Sphingobacteriia bacterium]|jgi:putative oxidoreductase|nr:DoxX family protein [Candidatus Fonsibacter lacus]
MKRLLSIKYSAGAFSAAMFFLRLSLGFLMMAHGYDKLLRFSSIHTTFLNFMGIGSTFSLTLVIFAEFFCSLFLILGLFTRISVIPLIITMCVALFQVHHGDVFGKGETDTLFLTGYFVLLFLGPGRVSVDSMISK